MEGPFNHPHPQLHLNPQHRRTASLEEVLERQAGMDRQCMVDGRQSMRGSSVKDCGQESTASSAVSSEYSREGTGGGDQWYKPYCYQDHQDTNQHLEEHDNSHDSGTASTTLCSSSPSSSPSPSMLTQGNLTGTTLPPLNRAGLPPPPPPHLTAAHIGQLGRRHPGLNDQHENSYAEIPYGSLPANNFDLPPGEHRGKLHLANPSGRNEWKNNNTVNPNSNLVHNLHLALDYPTRDTLSPNGVQQSQNQQFRTLDISTAPSERQTSMIHLRDAPDGLYPVPQPRMATMDVPQSDFKGSERYRKRKSRQTLIMVVVMALAGVAYLALGGMAGYYFGKSECSRTCSSRPFVAAPLTGNSTITYAFTTPHPGINGSTGNVSSTLEAGFSTTPTTTQPTSTTTLPTSTTEPPPQYCVQVNNECHCGPLGGSGGKAFNDRDDYLRLGNITGFAVKHNNYFISGLQMQYGTGSGAEHGYGEGGFRVNVQLLRGELIKAVEADFTGGRGYLSRLVVLTDKRVLGPYGGQGGLHYPLKGAKLLYILGRSGPMIDRLGFVFDRCT